MVETPGFEAVVSKEELSRFSSVYPLGHNAQPQGIAEAILYLASDKASWVRGAILAIDNGVTGGRHGA
ncbi:SDR family oxidoreductase [Scytonema sp. HK-05]|uniref:SDR family oxidoreductase n=1 Tax=Scytonema sp. HK-05 TaxID=1137095 RepID=UPI0009FA70C0|nr:SDR family oxidoreductase [Scytonema sp. HK-05]